MQAFSWLAELFALVAGCLAVFAYLEKKQDAEISIHVSRQAVIRL